MGPGPQRPGPARHDRSNLRSPGRVEVTARCGVGNHVSSTPGAGTRLPSTPAPGFMGGTAMATMVESRELWNPFGAASKANLLRVVREEADGLLELASDPSSWECGTAAGHWQVRDVVGHMVDVTEAYLERFAGTRAGSEV